MPLPTIQVLPVGDLQANCYLVVDGDAALLIDAGADADALTSFIASHAPNGLDAIVTTHCHHDHIGALAQIHQRTGASCWSGAPDIAAIAAATGITCKPLWDGDVVSVGSLIFDVIGLVGHTPGGIALANSDVIFTGDSLFPGGVGKTTSTTFPSLFTDVVTKIFDRYDDETVIWPGHGKPTTLGVERPHLDQWRLRGW
ncbi:MAG: MBL fold metallo-hydrolase [Propionibacteriaceae bacterium]